MVGALVPAVITWASSLFGQAGTEAAQVLAEQSSYNSLKAQMKSTSDITDYNANIIGPKLTELANKASTMSAEVGAFTTFGNIAASALGAQIVVNKSNVDLVNKVNA